MDKSIEIDNYITEFVKKNLDNSHAVLNSLTNNLIRISFSFEPPIPLEEVLKEVTDCYNFYQEIANVSGILK